ncbi:hypothetical protein [uncultured Hyphomicrobium sp.]|uniref:hypothetical protein n=1 Tax=uncultured Hyphomicrobium sp. TaxID=194373 RepID=UPI0025E6870E|nr:hypothetical protein [uncultured Hyphomicrobium sp.]
MARWIGLSCAAVSAAVILYVVLAAADNHYELGLLQREHGCYLDVIGIYCKGFPGAGMLTDALNFLYLLLLAVPTVLLIGLLSLLTTGTFPGLDGDAATISFLAAAMAWLVAFIAAAIWLAARAIRKLRQPEARD